MDVMPTGIAIGRATIPLIHALVLHPSQQGPTREPASLPARANKRDCIPPNKGQQERLHPSQQGPTRETASLPVHRLQELAARALFTRGLCFGIS